MYHQASLETDELMLYNPNNYVVNNLPISYTIHSLSYFTKEQHLGP